MDIKTPYWANQLTLKIEVGQEGQEGRGVRESIKNKTVGLTYR